MEEQNAAGNGHTDLVKVPPTEVVIEMKEINPLQWEPTNAIDAFRRCETLCRSGVFRKFQNPEQAYVVALKGREMGLSFMQSIEMFDLIETKGQVQVTMKSQGMVAIIQKQEAAEYIFCKEYTDRTATWVTKRKGREHEQSATFTIEMAEKRGLTRRPNWQSMPETMLMWRAASMLCRMAYPDVIMGLYDPDELRDESGFTMGQLETAVQATSAAIAAPTAHTQKPSRADQLKALASGEPAQAALPAQATPAPAEAPAPAPVRAPPPQTAKPEAEAAPVAEPTPAPEPPAEVSQKPDPTPAETAPTEEEENARKEEIRKAYKKIQKDLTAAFGGDAEAKKQAQKLWYDETTGPGKTDGLRNLQGMEEKLVKAQHLFRKVELAHMTEGYFQDVKEMGEGPTPPAPDTEEPWLKSIQALEAQAGAWEMKAKEAKEGPPEEDGPPPIGDDELPWGEG
jgi:hypothetical protein